MGFFVLCTSSLWGEGEEILKVFGYENVRIDPALKGTIPDLQTDNHSIPPLEKGGEGGFESGLSPKLGNTLTSA